MSDFNKILEQLSGEDNGRLLKVARFAELGMSASVVIHEIRQPLTALSMALQMTLEGLRDGTGNTESGIQEAIQLVAKTEKLLERARDFMSPTSDVAQVDLVDSITTVLSVFQWQLGPLSPIKLKADVPHRMPLFQADKAQIEQMLGNLISNGLDAVAEKKNGVVKLIAVSSEDSIEFIVADNGTGMSNQVKEKAFEPFYSTKGKNKGTGLGLFIVSQIVARYNGECRMLTPEELTPLDATQFTTGVSLRFPIEQGRR